MHEQKVVHLCGLAIALSLLVGCWRFVGMYPDDAAPPLPDGEVTDGGGDADGDADSDADGDADSDADFDGDESADGDVDGTVDADSDAGGSCVADSPSLVAAWGEVDWDSVRGSLTVPGPALDTTDCTTIVTIDGTEVCVILAEDLIIGDYIRITGDRPVAFLARRTLRIEGNLSAEGKSQVPGPGGHIGGPLGRSGRPADTEGGGGGSFGNGGGGGGFQFPGGAGGTGVCLGGEGGIKRGCCCDEAVVYLYGGSGGGSGGAGCASGHGMGGAGGGALYLFAGESLTVAAGVAVIVGGGEGQSGSAAAAACGAGGGGSGGTVVLESPSIIIHGEVTALGGRGGDVLQGGVVVASGGAGGDGTARPGAGGCLTSIGVNTGAGGGGAAGRIYTITFDPVTIGPRGSIAPALGDFEYCLGREIVCSSGGAP